MKMSFRRTLLSLVFLLVPLCVQAQFLRTGYSAQNSTNSARSVQNHSYGTWANLSNPWDYFPPADASGRTKMLGWSASIYRQSRELETTISRQKPGPATKEQLRQIRQVQLAAVEVHDTLRFGAHRGDLSNALRKLQERLELLSRQTTKTAEPKAASGLNRLYDQIEKVNGDRLTGNRSFEIPKNARSGSVDPLK